MTRDQAIAAAQQDAAQFAKRITVYRFRGWPPGVYSARDVDQLPPDAETFETFGAATSAEPESGQGSLF